MAGGAALRPWAAAEVLRGSAAGSWVYGGEGKMEILVRWFQGSHNKGPVGQSSPRVGVTPHNPLPLKRGALKKSTAANKRKGTHTPIKLKLNKSNGQNK